MNRLREQLQKVYAALDTEVAAAGPVCAPERAMLPFRRTWTYAVSFGAGVRIASRGRPPA